MNQKIQPLASWNGTICPLTELMIPAIDRGFFFGDGVYEVLRIYDGQPFLLEEHCDRLKYSLEQIRIKHSVELVKTRLTKLLDQVKNLEGIAYIQITRGTALRNHLFPPNTSPNEMIFVQEQGDTLGNFRDKGISLILTEDVRWHRPDIKSLNLLPNILARQQAFDQGAQEAVFERWDGRITEASSSNVFIVKNNCVLTPKSDQWILDGISRCFIKKLCSLNQIAFREATLMKADLLSADEIFLSSTTSEVIAATRLNGEQVSNGLPGPLSKKLYTLFRETVERFKKEAR